MRVLLTTYAFPDDRQAFIEQYVRALTDIGIEVCVVATAGTERRPPHDRPSGPSSVTVARASWSDARHRKVVTLLTALLDAARNRPGALRRLLRTLRRRHGLGRAFVAQLYVLAPIVARPADVVHIGWLTAAANWNELLPAITGPLVVSCHGSDLRIHPLGTGDYRERLRVVFDRADLVHCVSAELAERAVALGADPATVVVRSWGVDTRRFRPDPQQPSVWTTASRSPSVRVLSIGRLHWVKGYDYALLAVAAMRRAGVDVDYTIIGGGSERDRLPILTAACDLGLDGCVHLLGVRTRDEVLAALRTADVFLVASVSEGVSSVTLEAMAVGLPVVVTDVGGMGEVVTDGVEGRLVPPRDPQALADAMLKLAADEALRTDMGRRGRERVVCDFDSSATAKIMNEHYRRLVEVTA